MKRHIVAMIIVASGSVIGVITGLIVLLSTNFNWVAAILTTIIVVIVVEFVGFVIAAINMFGIFKNPDRILR